jgi:hypothetical protein
MPAPKADPAKCDVPGCGMTAAAMTDGSEKDPAANPKDAKDPKGGRKAIPKLNVCGEHAAWPFSSDAATFAAGSDAYRNR